MCCCNGCVRNGRGYISLAVPLHIQIKLFHIINVLLCCFSYGSHGFNRFSRMRTHCSFAGKHNCRCAVINSVCNIRNLCSCRAGVCYHRFQHLCCGYNNFACFKSLMNNHFLQCRNFFKRNFNTHIATGNHNSVCFSDNAVNMLDALIIFNFCNDFNIIPAKSMTEIAKISNISFCSAKGSGYKIIAHFCTKLQILHILFRKIRHCKRNIGNINTLMV